ncbi:hypothetical protein F511_11582 [Dorcoceras hygrometricum]|uniref:Uncharacterized protein n=1 Tax=Dorcoceras hygrometricum TaxID=472368 RepID=A0A2Z7DDB3_9LAMI|nr:hypothetical protein F511_11582 [Dorcoceras hygrometricum]
MVAMLDLFWLLLEVDHECRDLQTLHTYENHRYFISVFGIRNSRIKLKFRGDDEVCVAKSPADEFASPNVQLLNVASLTMRGRAAIPHSHLPAGIVATMRRVVNYHSSWARQQQVELFDASGNPGSTAGRGFNPAGGAPGGG